MHLRDGYLLLDELGIVIMANEALSQLGQESAQELLGREAGRTSLGIALCASEEGSSWFDALLAMKPGDVLVPSPAFRYPAADANGKTSRGRFFCLTAHVIPAVLDQARLLVVVRVDDVTIKIRDEDTQQREKALLRSRAQLRQVVARETDARLQTSQEQFAVALAFAKVGAWELDPTTGAIECTDQCKDNLGLGVHEVLSEARLFNELIAPEYRENVRSHMEAALREHRHFEAEYQLAVEDGSARWLLVRGQGMFAANGRLESILGFTIDITMRKQAELEQKRQTDIQREAREKSDQNALAMDQFVSAVSHELRSPLHALSSWTDLLERSDDPRHIEQAVGALRRNVRQLGLMVDDLLDTGAIVSGKLTVRLAPVALGALVAEVVTDLRGGADRKGIVVSSDVQACEVIGDESRLRQVVWNLLSNAVKFTERGSIHVAVKTHDLAAVITVQDTGAGLDPADVARVFERFAQTNGEASGRAGGLGLGLWLVRNLVDLHGGTVAVQSRGRGHGSLFRVTLPLSHD